VKKIVLCKRRYNECRAAWDANYKSDLILVYQRARVLQLAAKSIGAESLTAITNLLSKRTGRDAYNRVAATSSECRRDRISGHSNQIGPFGVYVCQIEQEQWMLSSTLVSHAALSIQRTPSFERTPRSRSFPCCTAEQERPSWHSDN
jgi:hypothetical protein